MQKTEDQVNANRLLVKMLAGENWKNDLTVVARILIVVWLCYTQADVNGLKWVRYVGPTSVTLEAPKDDPVLNSYAKLLNEG